MQEIATARINAFELIQKVLKVRKSSKKNHQFEEYVIQILDNNRP